MAVGGIGPNRKTWSANLMPGTDHLPATLNIAEAAYSKGQPQWGAHLADELERIIALHDASNVAAVIVEPLAGSAGVLVPPVGYLEKLREITSKHGILLIFDEVITAFGRLGAATAAERFNVTPDLITMAKAINNAAVPMGAVAVRREVHDTVINAGAPNGIELLHGYTYSGHPLACAAAIATLDLYQRDNLFGRAAELAPKFESAVHDLRGAPHVKDIRNLGLVAGVELEPRPGQPGVRAYEAFLKCLERGVLVRYTGDILAFSPPLIISEAEIDQLFDTVRQALNDVQ
ncbi:Omega-amino acid--pyruvate aminotransferase [compost metagenome]